MLFLETKSLLLENVVLDLLNKSEGERKPVEAPLHDLDDTSIHVIVVPEAPYNTVVVGLRVAAFEALASNGGLDALKETYGELVIDPMPGFDFSISFNLDTPVPDKAAFADKIARMKQVLFNAPVKKELRALHAGEKPGDAFLMRIRADQTIFIVRQADRVSLVTTVEFSDTTDRALAHRIGQGFPEAHSQVKGGAPLVLYDKEPPMDLEPLKGKIPPQSDRHVGYLSLTVFKSHVSETKGALSEKKLEAVSELLMGLRGFMMYHIKATKGHLHTRMRTRVESWLQVLERAKPEDPFAEKEKKLISGKTFTRK